LDEFLGQVLNYGYHHDIGYLIEPMEDPLTPPVSDTANRVIILNANWPTPREMAFQAAHEFSHVLNGDVGQYHYATSPARNRVEAAANRRALSIVIPMYFDNVDPDCANYQEFMDNLAIPYWLEDEARHQITDYYAGREEQKWM
jgi:hypothetical protein